MSEQTIDHLHARDCTVRRRVRRAVSQHWWMPLLAIAVLLGARVVACSTIPDQTWIRAATLTDAGDTDELISLIWTRSPGTSTPVTVVVPYIVSAHVDQAAILLPSPVSTPSSCSRAPPAPRLA